MNRILIRYIGFSLVAAVLMLAGSTVFGQNDPQFVITNNGHYLEHVKVGGNWQLRNTDSFNPNCLWYSGNTVDVTGINHNYYFIDLADTSYHFLSAPLEPNGTLGLSASFPGAQLLRNVEQIYYFYNWDMESPGEGGGVARGIQIPGITDSTACVSCGGSWSSVDVQCWTVYWAEYKSEDNKWELSSATSYDITENSGRFRKVTVQEHVTPVENTGLINLKMNDIASTNFEISWGEVKSLSSTIITDYQYTAYTSYVFGGSTHNYYNETLGGPSSDHGTSTPTSPNGQATSVASYEWTLTGDGANYISFDPDEIHSSSNQETPTLYYTSPSNTGNEMATLTLTVTYNDGSKQESSATIIVKVECQNPGQEDSPIVTYDNVTVTWYNTADRYKIYWTKVENVWDDANDSIVEGTNSYTFTGLDYNTTYWYKVAAFCNNSEMSDPSVFNFTTLSAPDLMIYGSVFGGGRVANVTGNTTVAVINCDTIGAVYGGNDIAGEVQGAKGSNIILGVDASSESDSYSHLYNNNQASVKVRVNDVYGGGNGYYAYNGTSFQAASSDYDSLQVAAGGNVMSMTQSNQVGGVIWTNESEDPYTLTFPKIVKTAITVTNNSVKIDSLFGGAKNAFLTYDDWRYNGDSIVIQGGTIFSVFGGNNIGGGQGKGKHYVKVTGTTTNLVDSIQNTATTGYGRDFGIRYLFGGGNKVYGSTTGVYIEGGQLDTIFAGGNSADVYAANITVNCSLEAGTGNTFGHTYSNAFESETYDGSDIHIKDDYEWDGFSGIYNVRTLFGGNNEASFDSKGNNAVPNITLTSGSVGTVYGGGNAGDMLAHKDGTITLDGDSPINMKHSTKVIMNSPNMLVDYLYGGCQVSNVDYSTWVEIQDGHVGYVYGGCNVSGDVGSTRVNPHAPSSPPTLVYQAVQGSTYVKTTGGTVYKNLFAGGNGFYHCNNGINYIDSDINYGDPEGYYIGLSIPTHNETHAIIGEGSNIKGNVYAGGNLAPVGFTDLTNVGKPFPAFVGLASVRVEDGTVEGDVYGGGNMAAIQGSNEVRVLGGTINGALYGGNDRLGEMAQISNRVLPSEYDVASDGYTSLKDLETRTYVAVSGRPHINTVYGGGNGAYDYSGTDQGGDMDYCNPGDRPIQGYTFVDIHIDGSPDNEHSIPAGHINTVYGGGNGVSVTGSITVFINVRNPNDQEHVGTVFGGNNMGDLELVPDVILLHGNVGTVYGGCNQGAMVGRHNFTIEGATYNEVGSMVHLRKEYVAYNSAATPTTHTDVPSAKVLNAVYGGCRMNGVQYDDQYGNTANTNTLVLVEGGQHPASMFGGSDISGTISGTSQVVVTGGQIGNVYGGGNGNYDYDGTNVYVAGSSHTPENLVASGEDDITAPVCNASGVDILGGQVGASDNRANIFGGGYGQLTRTDGDVTVNISRATGENPPAAPSIYGDIYGGSALGSVNAENTTTNKTTVNILDGSITGDVYGGGLGDKTNDIPAIVNGKVYVNIGAETNTGRMGNAAFYTYGEGNSLGGRVFGGNNVFGSPQDSIFVNVYKTAHGADPANNLYPTTPPNPYPGWTVEALAANSSVQTYAIQSVYGGGNQASYTPPLTSDNKPRSAKVHVHYCDNTIKDVYGGGNAADVGTTGEGAVPTNTFVIVDGGRIDRVFGGGNGEVTPANIYGTSSNTVKGGLINQVFGCGNMQGSITQTNLNLSDTGDCSDEVFGEVFGGANQAQFTGNLATEIICGVGQIGSIYGGSNLASIDGNVTLTIRGGDFKEVYGGSKGATAPANIDGNVTLNLHGGTIIQAFGGSNVNGNITGLITVNVDTIAGTCPLVLDTLFGSGNLTEYTPNRVEDNLITSPVVNLKNGTVRKAVFGSGKGASATVTANPQVNIGDPDNNSDLRLAQVGYMDGSTVYGGDIYGGGFKGAVEGGPVVNIRKANTMVYNSVFGGGDMANVSSTLVNMYNGTVKTGIYGGCNLQGTVGGNIEVNIVGGVLGVEGTPMPGGIFGGGYGQETATTGNVVLNIGDASNNPTIYADVYGGSALGKVNNVGKQTKVNFAKGTLHGNLYGGGLGQASPVIPALVNGNVEVNIGKDKDGATVDGGVIIGSVFGANNIKGTPLGNVQLNVYSGTLDSIFGGGNQANYEPTDASISYPAINVSSGEVIYKVVGGGNAAGVTANPHVNISGGKICTIPTGLKAGVYGGCNTTGTVNGNIVMNITSPANTADTTVIGTLSAIQYALSHNSLQAVSVHGGGYGANTATTGNITVTYGEDDGSADAECKYPKLYGDLYGGSALGSVNSDGDDVTMVKVLNGSLKFLPAALDNICGGSIYGGGLGDASHAATVNGKVHVYIGSLENGYRRGKAYLKGCDVFGCNNVNGSPQDDVYVDLWQTAHEEIDSVHYNDGTDMGHERYYAIRNVYGGGNRSHYAPVGNAPGYEKKVHNTVHECDNTVQNLYGGGNASDTDGTVVSVDGGRFKYIFGGGNGQVTAANILGGHVDITVYGGTVNWYFVGCNLHGSVGEGNTEHVGCSGDDCPCPDTLVVNNYYFGANEALTLEGLDHEINCGDNMDFRNVYAGSRLAVVYGDIKLTVRGGNITNLFGGSEGSSSVIADVRKYPMDTTSIPDSLIDLRLYMRDSLTHGHDIRGKGGNIRLILEGGSIKNVYGGNNENGNVEGEITIIVDSTQAHPCELDIDYIYSGNKHSNYLPDSIVVGGHKELPVSPAVYVKNGHVNNVVYGGSQGGESSLATSVGLVKSKPLVVIGDNDPSHKVLIGQHVYGGGSKADVIGDPSVVLQGNATVGGNVFGGGEQGDITGSAQVTIAPTEYVDTPSTPVPS